MSTRKDKFSLKDKKFMELALNLASARKGLTGDNPAVGCLIVKNDKIISIGQTGFNGRPHAEDNAIKNSLENLNGAKMYVTLEPCNHYGKTPPCTNAIINSDEASYKDYMNNRRINSDKQAEIDSMKEELETLKLMLNELASKITS